ncbi:MAG: RNA 2',3'-cyclic phosphodiesterase [Chloroflexota bacterium]
MLRCFLAVELPLSLQEAIEAATAVPRAKLGSDLVRWVSSRNVHLTLKFLGDTTPSSIELIGAALTAEVSQYRPFDVVAKGFGAFPSNRKPRVLWVGLTAPPALSSLQHELDVATARLGYGSEERDFSPHLTIGRVRQNVPTAGLQKIRDELEQTAIGELGTLTVEAVHLFKSELQPSGSVYTRLFTVALAKA